MRLGILGGSFDPVHNGHLAVARACLEGASLDEIWFVPAAIQPLKHAGPHASDEHRVEMLRLAVGDEPRLRVCTLEIDRGGLSYSVDTLRQLREELPDDDLFFIIGADVIADVPNWKEPAEVFGLATPLVVTRAGEPRPNLTVITNLGAQPPILIDMPPYDVSSSEIRDRLNRGESVVGCVSPNVSQYIRNHKVYWAR
jgi:nicotinate-nucleotide adenylyltransferase